MLPDLNLPEFVTNLPSDNREVFFRPFLVKEEKILLMALEGKDQQEIQNSVMKIMTNCVKMDQEEIESLPYFDIEHLFLQLRSRSVDNSVRLRVSHQNKEECTHVNEVVLDLNDVTVDIPEDHTNIIMLTDSVGVTLQYPSLGMATQLDGMDQSDIEKLFSFIASCMLNIFDGDNVYEDSTVDEKIEWLGNTNKSQFDKIMRFFTTMPTVACNLEYVCEACGKNDSVSLRGLTSFFS
jgi:hypothetical protein